jgi:hypothetical protein
MPVAVKTVAGAVVRSTVPVLKAADAFAESVKIARVEAPAPSVRATLEPRSRMRPARRMVRRCRGAVMSTRCTSGNPDAGFR